MSERRQTQALARPAAVPAWFQLTLTLAMILLLHAL